jgi:hypothetical protein
MTYSSLRGACASRHGSTPGWLLLSGPRASEHRPRSRPERTKTGQPASAQVWSSSPRDGARSMMRQVRVGTPAASSAAAPINSTRALGPWARATSALRTILSLSLSIERRFRAPNRGVVAPVAARRPPRRAPSANALEQLGGRGEPQSLGEDHEGLEAGRALAALQEADLGAVQVAGFGQRLLRESRSLSVGAQVMRELAAYLFHGHRPTFAPRRREVYRPLSASCFDGGKPPEWPQIINIIER